MHRFFPLLLLALPLFAAAQQIVKPMPRKGKLNLLVHPADVLVCEGMPVSFRAFAACSAPEVPEYQWQSSADALHWDDIAGETHAEFQFGLAKRAHNASQFRVRVSGAGDTIFSFPAQVLVESRLNFTQKLERQTVSEGATVTFEAEAETDSGNGVASYQWQVSPYASGVWMPLAGEIRPVLRLENVTAAQNGNSYRLLARTFNGCDSVASAPAFLVVAGKPVVSITPLSRSLCGGGQATFAVQIQGGTGKEFCQWQVKRGAAGEFEDLPTDTAFSLKINEITTQMNGWQYRAVVKLNDGSAIETQAASLTVHGSVAFSRQPAPVAVCMNEGVTFEVAASFEGKTPTYQWQFSTDGGSSWQNMPDARSAKLDLLYASAEMHGRMFRAEAMSGECGSVFSQAAGLTVFTGVKFTRQPRDVAVAALGDAAVFEADFEAQPGGDYSMTWEWSATGGATWQFMPGGKGGTLTLPRTTADMGEYLYRMKVLDKRCGRISYSEAARVLLP